MTSVKTRAYHHGDLRRALIEEGFRAARSGGPDAVTLREVTRAVGVSPNAAYRHFADRGELVRAAAAQAQLALAQAISDRLETMPAGLPAHDASVERLRLLGLGYIDFARRERGWFELAFTVHDQTPSDAIVTLDDEVVEPFRLLLDALDGMVAAGALAPEHRPHAEWACWSAVHGFADIAVHGPLQWQPPAVVDALAEVVVEAAITGVRRAPSPSAVSASRSAGTDGTSL
ncbi:TetR/AcrR family transcriptional regulator [Microbacterium lushaniae]|uniref:TetR/AcrR family transcriptional regulator n=1 Tax=Microbacterium lushaniae TaxID=2614639 RepID=A0A5J6L4C8_9MICO|nr:TetR/AcrR family transcriptional regulator [Microbacterium lushaniae]QEW03469.1 TetR/AcrR family transcriptional regulator [Microbacterium lushaniae]